MPRLPALLVAALAATLGVVAGCVGGTDDGDGKAPAASGAASAEAPWWDLGEYWEIDLTYRGQETRTYRLVNMWNDSATAHFWLGVKERALAMDHALYDTNPFLGRIHHHILAPHERGMHAVMYSFPLADGDRWSGELLAGDWEFAAEADPAKPGAFLIEGRGTDGSTIAYDYDPDVQWFRELTIKDKSGAVTLKAVLKAHGAGERGQFWFERGRDYYKGPEVREGTHSETVTVEDAGLDYLAVHFDLRATSTMELQVLDPSGKVRHRETVGSIGGGDVRQLVEIPRPAQGDWQVRFVTTGKIEGDIVATGIFETMKEL